MKRVIATLVVSCICILLGLSVKWNKEKGISLVGYVEKSELVIKMQ